MSHTRLDKFPDFSARFLQKRRAYFLCYTGAFCLLSFIAFFPLLYNGKSLIWKPDGLTQHYNALVYIGNWGRTILRTLITEHRLSVPLWDFSIGYGSDVLTTLHYYVIGDPLNLLSILTPVRFTEYLYSGLVVLRMYLAGLSFACFCFQMKQRRTAVLAGSLAYAFCGYSLSLAAMHPYFINPMIYLPLLLLGTERVMQKKSPHLLIGMTALSAVSNFYFFYMLAVLVILYCVIRFLTTRHDKWGKELLCSAGRVLAAALLGTAIAAFILLPVILQFLSDSRSGSELTYSMLYDLDYYEQFFDEFLSLRYSSNWTYLGYAPPALLCVFLLFLKKDTQKRLAGLRAAFVLLTLMLLLPAAGSAMNGFSYTANRWGFGYSFLVCLILVLLWPELFRLSHREKAGLLGLSFLYLALLIFLGGAGSPEAFAGLALLLLSLAAASSGPGLFCFVRQKQLQQKLPQTAVIFFLVFGICTNAVSYSQIYADSYTSRFVDLGQGSEELEHTASGMMSLFYPNQGTFFRFAQDLVPTRNDSLNTRTNTIHYYWSLSNGSITRFFDELAIPFEERAFKYDDVDNRASLHALASVRYYLSEDPNSRLPWSFTNTQVYEYLGDQYYVSETAETLPLGYTYDGYISREQYDSLTYIQRQQALTQGLLCDAIPTGSEAAELHFQDSSLPYEISCSEDVLEMNGSFYAAAPGAQLTLTFSSPADCETYLLIQGMQAESLNELDLYTTEPFSLLPDFSWSSLSRYEQNRIRRDARHSPNAARFTLNCRSEYVDTDFSYYASLTESSFDRTDFLINLGYSEEGQTQAVLTLPYAGIYSFSSLEVLSLPMSPLAGQIDALSQETLENITFGTNQITGTINLSRDKLLCLSIPWSSGWKLLVDGQEAELFPANTMYMGAALTAGSHTIELSYRTPGLKAGMIISAGASALWLALYLYRRRNRRNRSA